jgi:hypothetical protein
MGFGLVIRFIAHLYMQLVTTSNYSAVANSHTAIHYSTLKFSQPAVSSQFSGNDFRWWTFPFIWVPELCRCLSYQLTATAHNNYTAAVLWLTLTHSLTNQLTPLH